jgi:8-amino-7-oxononanoate synthase
VRSDRIVYMATLGKALGGYGAFVAGAEPLVAWLMQRARTYVFSTALPAAAAAAASEAIALLEEDTGLVRALQANIATFRDAANAAGFSASSVTAIQPVPIGDPARAVILSAALRERGLLVPAIRPPTVPEGTSRLRISLSAAHSRDQVLALVAAVSDVAR